MDWKKMMLNGSFFVGFEGFLLPNNVSAMHEPKYIKNEHFTTCNLELWMSIFKVYSTLNHIDLAII